MTVVFVVRPRAGRLRRKLLQGIAHAGSSKNAAPLHRIHALQLPAEDIRGSKTSYHSYELNVVLDDGSRLNVIDHGNAEKLRDGAGKLSTFLAKPIWDAINMEIPDS
jgi:hypothetical protein